MAQTYVYCVLPVNKDISRLSMEKVISIGFCLEKLSSISWMLMVSGHENLAKNESWPDIFDWLSFLNELR